MDDYTPLGRSKIAAQARRDLSEIRCPRDGAVMRVIGGTRATIQQANHTGVQKTPKPGLVTIDVMCPACRRHAMVVSLEERGQLGHPQEALWPGPRSGAVAGHRRGP